MIQKVKHSAYLVSDDDSNGITTANGGLTLPEDRGATNNAGLSPLFLGRNGYAGLGYIGAIWFRGSDGWLWSNVVDIQGNAYVFLIRAGTAWPSQHWDNNQIAGNSLRCLVSTNNRIMIRPRFEMLRG